MLEKGSNTEIDRLNHRFTKSMSGPRGAEVERRALGALGADNLTRMEFLVPPLVSGYTANPKAICMLHIPGFVVHDLLGILRDIIEYHPDHVVAQKAANLQYALVRTAHTSLLRFQTPETQALLHSALHPFAANYAYSAKLQESCEEIQVLVGRYGYSTGLADDIREVSWKLSSAPPTYFRDAAFHNQILLMPGFSEEDVDRICFESSGYRHRPYLYSHSSSALLRKFEEVLCSINVSSMQIYNVDFEQAAEKVAWIDDWVHILTAEVIDWPYDECVRWARHWLGADAELFHYSVLYRAIRAWSRRLYYRRTITAKVLRHYRYQTRAYNYTLACTALEHIRMLGGNGHKLSHLSRLLYRSGPYVQV